MILYEDKKHPLRKGAQVYMQ